MERKKSEKIRKNRHEMGEWQVPIETIREVTKQISVHRSKLTKRPSRTTARQPGGTRGDRKTLKAGNDSQEAAAPPACIWDGLCLTPADRARGEGALLMRLRNPSLGWGTFLKGCLCDTVPRRCQPWNLWSTQINTHTLLVHWPWSNRASDWLNRWP